MKPEDIKVGETYYVRVTCDEISCGDVIVSMKASDTPKYGFTLSHSNAMKLLSPIPAAPKYDPCRLFRKGDEVEYRPKDGRANPNLLVGRKYKVSVDEPCDSGIVQVEFNGLRHLDTFVAYNNLELVTPVEELEPYFVMELKGGYGVYNTRFQPETEACHYWNEMHPNAKAAAEAECDRLNAEYRKEQSNG